MNDAKLFDDSLSICAEAQRYKHGDITQDQLYSFTKKLLGKSKDTRIAELEAQLKAERDKATYFAEHLNRRIDEVESEREKVERLRDIIADLIAGGESAEQTDPRLGYIELQTDRETLARARGALAATVQTPCHHCAEADAQGRPSNGACAHCREEREWSIAEDIETIRLALESARGWVPERTEDDCWSMVGEALATLDRIAGVLSGSV